MKRRRMLILGVCAAAALRISPLRAADSTWNLTFSGNWNVPGNWIGGVPGSGSNVYITFSDSNTRIITYNYPGPAVTYSQMLVNNDGTGSTLFAQNASTTIFSSGSETIGTTGKGGWVLNGGVHNDTSSGTAMIFGSASGSGGSGIINNGTLNVTGFEIVGNLGTGTFSQSNGVNNIGTLDLGSGSSGVGMYTQSGGTLSTGAEIIADAGVGTLLISAGLHSVTGPGMTFGNLLGASGVGTLNGGAMNVASAVALGSHGFGTLTLSTGTLIAGSMSLGAQSDGAGIFKLDGGVASISSSLSIGDHGTGSTSIQAGSLTVIGDELIGNFGAGTLNQGGGVHTVGSASSARLLELGAQAGSTGTYLLSGTGSLIVYGTVVVGESGAATFNQSGGAQLINTPGSVTSAISVGQQTGGTGIYLLGGGTLTANGLVTIGGSGAGTFSQTGGIHTANYLNLADASTGLGTYLLSGTGSLIVNGNESIGGRGTATFSQSSGIHILGNGPGTGYLSIGDSVSGRGSYLLSGSGSLTVNGGDVVGNAGMGSFTQTGGAHVVGTPAVPGYLAIGVFPGSSGTYLLSGGTLAVNGIVHVGEGGVGTFSQIGATHAADHIFLGYSTGGSGLYTLSGNGSLAAKIDLTIGERGAGTFNQTSGTVVVGTTPQSGQLIIADQGNSSGTYLLAPGATLTVNGSEFVGYFGAAATFSQSGGVHTIGTPGVFNAFRVGGGAPGTFLMGGGTLTANAYVDIGLFGAGTFIQTAGTVTIGSASDSAYIELGYYNGVGTYRLSGAGVLAVSGYEHIGAGGAATFTQDSGTNTTPYIFLAGTSGGLGRYFLNSGTLNVNVEEYVGDSGDGSFVQSGGSHSIAQNLNVGAVTASSGNFLLSGGPVNIGSNANIGGGAVSAGGTGLLRISGGTMTVGGTLKVYDTGAPAPDGTAVNLLGGFLSAASLDTSGNPSRFSITGGTFKLTSSNLNIGSAGQLGAAPNISSSTLLVPLGTTIDSGGKLQAIGGTMSGGSLTNSGRISTIDSRLTFTAASSNAAGATISLISSTLTLGTSVNQLTNQGRMNLIDTTINGDISNTAGGVIDTAGTVTFNGAITGPAPFTGTGVKVFAGGNSNIGAIGTQANTIVQSGAVLSAGSIMENSLTVAGHVVLSTSGGTSRVRNLSIAGTTGNWTGKLDLTNNSLVVDYDTSSPLADVNNQITTARAGGSWTGNGITTSMADAAHGLGYADNSAIGLTSFGGLTVDATSVLIKFTYLGDSNLDGQVNVNDLYALASNYNASGKSWTAGDFNYDGVVNVQDLTLLAKNWQAGVGAPLAASLDTALTNLGLPIVAVPEPAQALVLSFSIAVLGARRPRARTDRKRIPAAAGR